MIAHLWHFRFFTYKVMIQASELIESKRIIAAMIADVGDGNIQMGKICLKDKTTLGLF